MGLSFTTAAGPRQRSHSQVWLPRDSWPHFTVWNSRLPQPGGPGPCIYITKKQGGPIISPGTGFPFRRLRFRATVEVFDLVSTRESDSSAIIYDWLLLYNVEADRQTKHFLLLTGIHGNVPQRVCSQESISKETCLSARSLAIGLHVTINKT
jgi:hypothetical protein